MKQMDKDIECYIIDYSYKPKYGDMVDIVVGFYAGKSGTIDSEWGGNQFWATFDYLGITAFVSKICNSSRYAKKLIKRKRYM